MLCTHINHLVLPESVPRLYRILSLFALHVYYPVGLPMSFLTTFGVTYLWYYISYLFLHALVVGWFSLTVSVSLCLFLSLAHTHTHTRAPYTHTFKHTHTHTEHRSGYRKSLPGQFIRIHLKTEQNCRLFLDIFSSAIMNDLFMTFTSTSQGGCQMCLTAVKLDHSGELFWDTPS